MKKLYLIGGPMGVGKTSVCQLLKRELRNSVFLDGDWCWDAAPFQITPETKTMVLDNICHLLNNFLHCSAYENIIFCWVMHEQSIIDSILARLDLSNCLLYPLSLVCDAHTLKERLTSDILNGLRGSGVLTRSMTRLPLYETLETIKIDTTAKDVPAVVREIISLS